MLAGPLMGQQSSRLSGGLGIQSIHVRTEAGPQIQLLSGTVIALEGRVRFGPVHLVVDYQQGKVNPDSGIATARDLIEGRALLGVRLVRWLGLRVGPHARAYVTPAGTQRWLLGATQLRLEPTLVPGAIRSYLDVWQVVSGNVNLPEAFKNGTGAEAGMIVQLRRRPIWGQLSYGIDRLRLGGTGRIETVDRLTLTLGLGRH
jgi:hypothetical protein